MCCCQIHGGARWQENRAAKGGTYANSADRWRLSIDRRTHLLDDFKERNGAQLLRLVQLAGLRRQFP